MAALSSETISTELDRLAPVLLEMGLKTPFRHARALLSEETSWGSDAIQSCWQSRLDFWRSVVPAPEGGTDWPSLVNLDCGALAPIRDDLLAGGAQARTAWTRHICQCTTLQDILLSSVNGQDEAFCRAIFESDEWGMYDASGRFLFDRPEGLVRGEIYQLDLEPVVSPPDADYDWAIAHPRDRLFQNGHQSGYQFIYLALAHLHRPSDTAWARTFRRMVLALVDQCPRLPDGFHDFGPGDTTSRQANVAWSHYGYVANRLSFFLPTYLAFVDSPEFDPRFHELFLRLVMRHARHLHELREVAYRDNYMIATGKALYFAAALMPQLVGREDWLERMWPLLQEGLEREVLPDGCHMHRSFSYHLSFIQRPLNVFGLEHRMRDAPRIPEEIRSLVERATDAFVQVSTPIRSTPGINDDWTVGNRFHHLLGLAAEAYGREDWRYLSTDGARGAEPSYRSCLLPDAQVLAMRSDWTRGAHYLFFNASPNGGHYHPDPLSIQVWSGGSHLLVDPGVGHYYTGEREIARQSRWHTCPTLGEADLPTDLQPEVLHWETSSDLDYAAAQIRIPSGQDRPAVGFRRHVFFVGCAWFLVWDEFDGVPHDREVWENLHFRMQEVTVAEDDRRVVMKSEDGNGIVLAAGQGGWRLQSESGTRWVGYGAPGMPTALLHFIAGYREAARGFAAVIVPFAGGAEPPQAGVDDIRTAPDGSVALHVRVSDREHVLETRRFPW